MTNAHPETPPPLAMRREGAAQNGAHAHRYHKHADHDPHVERPFLQDDGQRNDAHGSLQDASRTEARNRAADNKHVGVDCGGADDRAH